MYTVIYVIRHVYPYFGQPTAAQVVNSAAFPILLLEVDFWGCYSWVTIEQLSEDHSTSPTSLPNEAAAGSHFPLHTTHKWHKVETLNNLSCLQHKIYKYMTKRKQDLPARDQSRSLRSCLSANNKRKQLKCLLLLFWITDFLETAWIHLENIFTACKPLVLHHLLPQMSYTWDNAESPVFFYAEHWGTVLYNKKNLTLMESLHEEK